MTILFTNNAKTTLSAGITNVATSIPVAAGYGALFPAPSGSDFFYATITDVSNNIEIVKVTSRSTDTMTVVRGQEGTTARAYLTGDKFQLRITAASLTAFVQLAGTQTLTNKTIDTASGNVVKVNGNTLAASAGTATVTVPNATCTLASTATTDAIAAALVPVAAITTALTGQVAAWATATPPTGWLECDGASLLRADYAALFAVIGVTWGTVDGTHFTLPDLRGEFIRGYDNGKGTDPARAFASSQTDEFEAHTHTTPTVQTNMNSTGGTTTGGAAGSGTTTGSAGSTETRPRNFALMYCIKT